MADLAPGGGHLDAEEHEVLEHGLPAPAGLQPRHAVQLQELHTLHLATVIIVQCTNHDTHLHIVLITQGFVQICDSRPTSPRVTFSGLLPHL